MFNRKPKSENVNQLHNQKENPNKQEKEEGVDKELSSKKKQIFFYLKKKTKKYIFFLKDSIFPLKKNILFDIPCISSICYSCYAINKKSNNLKKKLKNNKKKEKIKNFQKKNRSINCLGKRSTC